jgi:hypothetical protein
LNAGNTEFLKLGASARIDFFDTLWYSFLVGNYERGSNDEDLFTHKAFAHLRLVRTLLPALRLEAFGQKEFNDFIRLKDRNLAGGGARITALHLPGSDSTTGLALNIGIGAMWENEETTGEGRGEVNLLRSTNYLAFTLRSSKLISLSITGYYQPVFRDFDDFRLLTDASVAFSITDALAFTTTMRYRFDSQPPPDLKRFDLEMANGVTVRF